MALVFYSLPIILLVLTVLLWPREGPMGINLARVYCPKCGLKMPIVRRPQNQRQAMWGGWTCPCGCEMDKYGKEID
jgi:hypothetical protein